MGFVKAGFEIVYANDFDKYAVQTYNANFDHKAVCADINHVDFNQLPIHDVLIGGFPCQPFSMMGMEQGFEDRRGKLFYRFEDVVNGQISQGNKPKIIVLENVNNLQKHDHGNTYKVIKTKLEEMGYRVFCQTLNSADYGVPQIRRRTFIVCFLDHSIEYEFPSKSELTMTLQDLLENDVEDKYFLSERIKKTILANGSGKYYAKSEVDLSIARPLTATMAKMHRANQDNYVTQNGKLRKLTPRECARLQGFDDDFVIPVSDSQAYKQFGNAVTVNVSFAVAKSILDALENRNGKKIDRRNLFDLFPDGV